MAGSSAPLRLAAVGVACAVLAGAPLPPALRAIGALPLVLYLPGRCWLAVVLPRNMIDGETRALAAALSLALAVLLGVLLASAGLLGEAGWIAASLALCLASCIVAAVVQRAPATGSQKPAAPSFGIARFGALVLAIGVAAYAYAEARRGALQQQPDAYTDFWIVPQGGPTSSLAFAGVRNEEGRAATYAVDVVARGRAVDRGTSFLLSPGAERTLSIALPSVVFADAEMRPAPAGDSEPGAPNSEVALERNRVELRLFKDGDRTAAYRRVWVALPPPIKPKPDVVAQDAPAGDLSFSGSAVSTLRASLRAAQPTLPGEADVPPPAAAAVPTDATRPLAQSQVAAWRMPAGPGAVQPLRATSAPDILPSLRSPRFTPSRTVPADPSPLSSE